MFLCLGRKYEINQNQFYWPVLHAEYCAVCGLKRKNGNKNKSFNVDIHLKYKGGLN